MQQNMTAMENMDGQDYKTVAHDNLLEVPEGLVLA